MPLSGVVYCKLAIMDKDGSITFAKIVLVTVGMLVIDNVKVSASTSTVRVSISTSTVRVSISTYQSQESCIGRVVVSKNT
jgi:hypothetical protein